MDPLAEALHLANEAVRQDTAGNFEEASALYAKVIVKLENAYINEKDSSRKSVLGSKMKEYQQRNKQLKEINDKNALTKRMGSIGKATLPALSTMPTTKSPSNFVLPSLKNPHEMSKEEAYSVGSMLCQLGKDEDAKGNGANAIMAYRAATEYLQRALEDETEPSMRANIQSQLQTTIGKAQFPHQQSQSQLQPQQYQQPQWQQQQQQSSTSQYPTHQFPNQQSQQYSVNSTLQYPAQLQSTEMDTSQQICFHCKKPISINEPIKLAMEHTYHVPCFADSVGLVRTEEKYFTMENLLGWKETIVMTVELKTKRFKPGEQMTMNIHIHNKSSKKVHYLSAYLLKTETFMEVVRSSYGAERKPRVKESKEGEASLEHLNPNFPVESNQQLELKDTKFVIPMVQPSELSGPYCLEYELVVKAVISKSTDILRYSPLKVIFPVTIVKS